MHKKERAEPRGSRVAARRWWMAAGGIRSVERLGSRIAGARPGSWSGAISAFGQNSHDYEQRSRQESLGGARIRAGRGDLCAGRAAELEGWEDSAVAPEKLGGYLRDLSKLAESYKYRYTLYGHFGDGCVHNRLSFDLESADGIKKFRKFMEEAADLVLSYGGSLSGEHGDGQARAELLPKMFGPELIEAFRRFKALWDPEWKMNPGKLVLP